jgi:hypothetical protein
MTMTPFEQFAASGDSFQVTAYGRKERTADQSSLLKRLAKVTVAAAISFVAVTHAAQAWQTGPADSPVFPVAQQSGDAFTADDLLKLSGKPQAPAIKAPEVRQAAAAPRRVSAPEVGTYLDHGHYRVVDGDLQVGDGHAFYPIRLSQPRPVVDRMHKEVVDFAGRVGIPPEEMLTMTMLDEIYRARPDLTEAFDKAGLRNLPIINNDADQQHIAAIEKAFGVDLPKTHAQAKAVEKDLIAAMQYTILASADAIIRAANLVDAGALGPVQPQLRTGAISALASQIYGIGNMIHTPAVDAQAAYHREQFPYRVLKEQVVFRMNHGEDALFALHGLADKYASGQTRTVENSVLSASDITVVKKDGTVLSYDIAGHSAPKLDPTLSRADEPSRGPRF